MLDNGPETIPVLVIEQVEPSIEAVKCYQTNRPNDRFAEATHNKSPMKSNLEGEKRLVWSNLER